MSSLQVLLKLKRLSPVSAALSLEMESNSCLLILKLTLNA